MGSQAASLIDGMDQAPPAEQERAIQEYTQRLIRTDIAAEKRAAYRMAAGYLHLLKAEQLHSGLPVGLRAQYSRLMGLSEK